MDEAPRKPAGGGRWILLGCAAVGGVVLLGFAGCAGLFYYIYSSTGDIAAVGAEYLRAAPQVREGYGDDVDVRRSWTHSQVHVTPSGGNASFAYSVAGGRNRGDATVWLVKSGSAWKPTGARVSPSNGSSSDLVLGAPPVSR